MTLSEAVDLALRRSPVSTQAATTRTSAAVTLARGVSGLLPSISVSASYALSGSDSMALARPWTATVSASQVVLSPTAFLNVASSTIQSGYLRISARDQSCRLVYDVTAAYFDLLKADQLRDVSKAAFTRAHGQYGQVRERQRLGLVSAIDLLRAEVQESQARINLLDADRARVAANEAFKAAAGIGGTALVVPTERPAEPCDLAVADPDSLVGELEQRSAATAMAKQSSSAARLDVASAVGGVLPDLSLSWQSSYSGMSAPASLKTWQDGDEVSYGLRATIPLLNLKSYILNAIDATNASRCARAAERLTQLQTRATATTAVNEYVEARAKYDMARANLELNERLHRLASEQLRLGSISRLDCQSVEADLVSAQSSYVGAVCDTYVRAAYISYLLGVSAE